MRFERFIPDLYYDITVLLFAPYSLSERIASVEAALNALSSPNSNMIAVAPDTGKDALKPTYVTYQFIGVFTTI